MKHPVRFKLIILVGLWLAFVNTNSAADSNSEGWEELVSIYYKLEVINYCGLGSQRVVDGFKLKNDQILGQYKLNPKQVDSARAKAWKAGYSEWDNRGLGGFRRWCANEGASYVVYFTGIADQSGSSR